MKKILSIVTLIISISSLASTSGWAYQEMEVSNGGSIQGKVTLTGKMPYPRIYHLALFSQTLNVCRDRHR
ncbi:MAG: hypothetical protein Ct9H300mP23_02500 [Nitrospinota bacterium]|nr:MAG: hypothetical protein Ct9H300mP23_02500 [Nitrospinota bacterium]